MIPQVVVSKRGLERHYRAAAARSTGVGCSSPHKTTLGGTRSFRWRDYSGGRVLMYFGAVLLVTAFVLFLNARVVSSGQPDESLELFIDMPFMTGFLILGLPYLAWMAWRRREKLIGGDSLLLTVRTVPATIRLCVVLSVAVSLPAHGHLSRLRLLAGLAPVAPTR